MTSPAAEIPHRRIDPSTCGRCCTVFRSRRCRRDRNRHRAALNTTTCETRSLFQLTEPQVMTVRPDEAAEALTIGCPVDGRCRSGCGLNAVAVKNLSAGLKAVRKRFSTSKTLTRSSKKFPPTLDASRPKSASVCQLIDTCQQGGAEQGDETQQQSAA